MRILKFRAWDVFNGEMFPKPVDDDLLVKFFREVNERKVGGNTVHIMQFTGLQDRNGREIYESDKINFFDISESKYDKAIIEWDKSRCALVPKTNFGFITWDFVDQIEIIGNIYETLDLRRTPI